MSCTMILPEDKLLRRLADHQSHDQSHGSSSTAFAPMV